MLVNMNEVLRPAKQGKYAVGLFNAVNLELAMAHGLIFEVCSSFHDAEGTLVGPAESADFCGVAVRQEGEPAAVSLIGAACSREETFEQEINQVMENLAAVAERTWSVRRTVTDEEYHDMFQSQRMRIAKIIQDR